MITVPEQLPNVLDRAIRIAGSRRTVTAVIIPSDVQELDYSPPDTRVQDGALQPGSNLGSPSAADDDALRRAAEVLNAGEKVAILVGQGARGAADEVISVADCSGPASPKPCLARMSCPTSCPGSPARSACSALVPRTS